MTACRRRHRPRPLPVQRTDRCKETPCSSSRCNAMSQDIVIMAVTSQTEWSFDIGECLVKDWEGAGLLKPSAIKTPISTIEQRVVLRKLGALSADDPASLNNLLREFLDIRQHRRDYRISQNIAERDREVNITGARYNNTVPLWIDT